MPATRPRVIPKGLRAFDAWDSEFFLDRVKTSMSLDSTPEQARTRWRVPIVKTEASRGTGVDELVERLDEHRAHILAAGQLAERRARNLRNEVLAIATARMRRRLEEDVSEDARFAELIDRVVERRLDPASAAAALLERETADQGGSR